MKVTRTSRVNVEDTVGVANVFINFEYSGTNAPTQMNVSSNHTEEGVTSSLYRTYTNNQGVISYNPTQTTPRYPFDAAFNADLMLIMENLFENYATI